jgi:hypothetical protein
VPDPLYFWCIKQPTMLTGAAGQSKRDLAATAGMVDMLDPGF